MYMGVKNLLSFLAIRIREFKYCLCRCMAAEWRFSMEKKKMKLWKKIVLICLAVIVVLAAIIFVWQRNNIMAVVETLSSSGDQIAQKLDDNKKALEEDLKEEHPTIVRDFTAEEEKQIMKGELSVDDAVANLNREYQSIREQYNIKSTGNSETDRQVDNLIGDKVIELYSLKAYYLGQLGQLESKVKSEYAAFPDSKKNMSGKKELAGKYIGQANSLLNQCDSRVSALLSELQSSLKSLGADTSIIKTIQSAYENEKALKKAYYLKLLGQ